MTKQSKLHLEHLQNLGEYESTRLVDYNVKLPPRLNLPANLDCFLMHVIQKIQQTETDLAWRCRLCGRTFDLLHAQNAEKHVVKHAKRLEIAVKSRKLNISNIGRKVQAIGLLYGFPIN